MRHLLLSLFITLSTGYAGDKFDQASDGYEFILVLNLLHVVIRHATYSSNTLVARTQIFTNRLVLIFYYEATTLIGSSRSFPVCAQSVSSTV
jgi:hypothetical protein